MNWIQRYRLRHSVRNSIWILPVFGMVAALVTVNCLNWIEQQAGWQSSLDPAAALALFGTLAGSMLTFIVFLSASLLLVVQLASAQLSPRIIGVVFRDRVTRFALTLFAFTFTFTLAVLGRIHASVPGITAHLAAYLCLLSVGVFLFLIDHVGKTLRPSGALRAVALLRDWPTTAPARCGWSIGRPIGRTSFTWRSRKSVSSAAQASRRPAASALCRRT